MAGPAPVEILFVALPADGAGLAEAVRGLGHPVRQVGRAGEALALADCPPVAVVAGEPPDLAASELCRRLRAAVAPPPLVLLLAPAGPADLADAYLPPPVAPGELAALVRLLARLARAERAERRREQRFQDVID